MEPQLTYHSFLIFILCIPNGTEQWVLNTRVHNLVGEIYLFFIIPLASVIFGMQRVFCFHLIHLVSVQFSRSVMPNSATPWTAALQASLSITNYQRLRKFMFIQSVMLSNHIILCHSLLLRLQSFPASGAFLVSQFFTSGGQNIVVSASASVLPKKIQN